jgi:hypothetical protein
MEQIFLSRRNLLSLLEKLDNKKPGHPIISASIIKHDGQGPDINQTIPIVCVTAVEDEVYYGANHV